MVCRSTVAVLMAVLCGASLSCQLSDARVEADSGRPGADIDASVDAGLRCTVTCEVAEDCPEDSLYLYECVAGGCRATGCDPSSCDGYVVCVEYPYDDPLYDDGTVCALACDTPEDCPDPVGDWRCDDGACWRSGCISDEQCVDSHDERYVCSPSPGDRPATCRRTCRADGDCEAQALPYRSVCSDGLCDVTDSCLSADGCAGEVGGRTYGCRPAD